MKKRLLFLAIFLLLHSYGVFAQKYKDPKVSVEERINDLLPRMTLEEKVYQLTLDLIGEGSHFDFKGNYILPLKERYYVQHPIGYFFSRVPLSMEKYVELTNMIQKHMMENTRLGIPIIKMSEGLHGFMELGATSFPQAIALGSSWDTTLVERVCAVAALEGRSRGSHQFLSPVVDIAREPRWGRFEECYGEDPYLASRLGLAAVFGYQGREKKIDNDHILATLKHFVGHGQPEGGKNKGLISITERHARETHLFPFEVAIKQGNARNVMVSYNDWDGVPNHMNKKLLTDIARGEWGFNGCFTGDGDGVKLLVGLQRVAANYSEAAKLAVEAGIDVEVAETDKCFPSLIELVKKGTVSEQTIDRAVRYVLRNKFEMGLFENPYTDLKKCIAVTNTKAHKALALEAAHKSIILLKNENNLLPLDSTKIKTLAVIGPNAADIHMGEYSYVPMKGKSVLAGMQEFAKRKNMNVTYAEGCKITANKECNWLVMGNPILNSYEDDQKLIDQAVSVAQNSDAILLVIGGNEITTRETWNDNHQGEVDNLDLIGRQNDLVKAVLATGKPVTVMLLNGRPISINYVQANVPAILEGWYLGEETGTAVANVLFGKVNPSGKLIVTFPRSVGQLPCYYSKYPSQVYYSGYYIVSDNSPLYPFGFGLSYTTYDYKNLRLSKDTIKIGEPVKVFVDVTNTGKVEGQEVVQLYIRDVISSITRPIKELKDFAKITLKPGQTKTVTFTITPDKLQFYNIDMKRIIEPGEFEIMTGKNSEDFLKKVLNVK